MSTLAPTDPAALARDMASIEAEIIRLTGSFQAMIAATHNNPREASVHFDADLTYQKMKLGWLIETFRKMNVAEFTAGTRLHRVI